jgi:periplasmic protein TonB
MFTNLIESSSHAKEFKRRGSFVLFTTGTYVLLFVVTGVVSIYAYDARLEEQNLEMVTLISPQEIAPAQKEIPEHPAQPKPTSVDDSGMTHRAIAMLSVNHPEVPPVDVSTTPNKNAVLPDSGGPVIVDGFDKDASGPGLPGSKSGGRIISQPPQVVIPDELPPAPTPTPAPPKVLRVTELINSKALVLPKPPYPPLAKQIRLQGTVVIQVLIDENGKVLSARPVSGHPMLIAEAQRAAMQAKFSPTTLNGVAVKVSGMISYNFQMPQ